MTQAASEPVTVATIGTRPLMLVGVAAGFVLVPMAARWSPIFVNGLLFLILIGTVVGNSDRWLPWFTGALSAGSTSIRGGSGGGGTWQTTETSQSTGTQGTQVS